MRVRGSDGPDPVRINANGRLVDRNWLLDSERLAEIERVSQLHSGQPLRSLLSHLSFDLSEPEVLLLEQTTHRQKSDHWAR